MDREHVLKLWDEMWEGGAWFAPWSKALDGLTPEQAAWRPQPGRHSIWQLVSHVAFWREQTLAQLGGRPGADAEECARRNFPEPGQVTAAAWAAERARLEESQRLLRAAIADPAQSLERPRYHLVHDANHLGQILYLRGMQGLAAIEV